MAKITDLKFKFSGVDRKVPVNCNSQGKFYCYLPDEIADALGIFKKVEYDKLPDLEKQFFAVLHRYKQATVKEEIFIAIKYQARGLYSMDSKGRYMWGGYRHPYSIDISFAEENLAGLIFFYDIVMKITTDGVEQWYHAEKGEEGDTYFNSQGDRVPKDPNKWYKKSEFYQSRQDAYKIIPYSDAAKIALDNIQEKIRNASEILFRFIEQDTPQIESMLLNQKLLG